MLGRQIQSVIPLPLAEVALAELWLDLEMCGITTPQLRIHVSKHHAVIILAETRAGDLERLSKFGRSPWSDRAARVAHRALALGSPKLGRCPTTFHRNPNARHRSHQLVTRTAQRIERGRGFVHGSV